MEYIETAPDSELLERLHRLPGPSGQEDCIRAELQRLTAWGGNTARTDALGNLIVSCPGTGEHKRTLLFSAHMDTVGLMVTEITDEGFLRFAPLGGLLPADLARAQVVFCDPAGQERARGVVVPAEEKESKSFTLDDLYLDIGAGSKSAAEALVQPGDCAVYAPVLFRQGQRIFATFLDNRAGCAALVAALNRFRNQPPYHDLYLVFSAQEEVGMRGARPAAFGLRADYGFGIDVTCTADQPGSDHSATAKLGGGAALKLMDHSVLCDRPLLHRMQQLAAEKGISCQTDIMKVGGTDAGAIQPVREGLPVGGISLPCRYTHSPVECIDQTDFQAVVDLIQALAESEWTV